MKLKPITCIFGFHSFVMMDAYKDTGYWDNHQCKGCFQLRVAHGSASLQNAKIWDGAKKPVGFVTGSEPLKK